MTKLPLLTRWLRDGVSQLQHHGKRTGHLNHSPKMLILLFTRHLRYVATTISFPVYLWKQFGVFCSPSLLLHILMVQIEVASDKALHQKKKKKNKKRDRLQQLQFQYHLQRIDRKSTTSRLGLYIISK
jgi:hypothetical protein